VERVQLVSHMPHQQLPLQMELLEFEAGLALKVRLHQEQQAIADALESELKSWAQNAKAGRSISPGGAGRRKTTMGRQCVLLGGGRGGHERRQGRAICVNVQ
jgi:exonuclease VII small subunit